LLWIEAAHLEIGSADKEFDQEEYDAAWGKLKSADGVVVPGGFGNRYGHFWTFSPLFVAWHCCAFDHSLIARETNSNIAISEVSLEKRWLQSTAAKITNPIWEYASVSRLW